MDGDPNEIRISVRLDLRDLPKGRQQAIKEVNQLYDEAEKGGQRVARSAFSSFPEHARANLRETQGAFQTFFRTPLFTQFGSQIANQFGIAGRGANAFLRTVNQFEGAQLRGAVAAERMAARAAKIDAKGIEKAQRDVDNLVKLLPALSHALDQAFDPKRGAEVAESLKRLLNVPKITRPAGEKSQATIGQAERLARSFGNIPRADQAAIAEELFGQKAAQALPLINKAAAGLNTLEGAAIGAGEGVGEAGTAMASTGAAASAMAGPIGIAVLAALAMVAVFALVVGGLFKATGAAAEYGDEIYKMHLRTAVSTETLSVLSVVAKENEVSFDSLGRGVGRFEKNLQEAARGNKDLAATFLKVGIDAKTGIHEPEKAFNQLAVTLAKLGPSAAPVAIKLIGRDAAQALPALKEYGANIEAATERARKMGLVLSTDQAQALHNYKEQVEDLGLTFKGLGTRIGADFAPAAALALKLITTVIQGLAPAITGVADIIIWLLDRTIRGIIVLVAAIQTVPTVVAEAGDYIDNLAETVAAFFQIVVRGQTLMLDIATGNGGAAIDQLQGQLDRLQKAQAGLAKSNGNVSESFRTNLKALLDVNAARLKFGSEDIDLPEKVKREKTELEKLTEEYKKLTFEVESFRKVGSEEFRLRYKVEDLRALKSSLEGIVKLRRELGLKVDAPLPVTFKDAQDILDTLNRQKRVKDDIKKVTEEQADAESRLAVVQKASTLAVVDAVTRYNTAWYEGIRKRRDAERQLTADIALEIRERARTEAESQQDFDSAQAQATLERLRAINQARSELRRAAAQATVAGLTDASQVNNRQVSEAVSLARGLTSPRTPVTERLDTSNKLLAEIASNTRQRTFAGAESKGVVLAPGVQIGTGGVIQSGGLPPGGGPRVVAPPSASVDPAIIGGQGIPPGYEYKAPDRRTGRPQPGDRPTDPVVVARATDYPWMTGGNTADNTVSQARQVAQAAREVTQATQEAAQVTKDNPFGLSVEELQAANVVLGHVLTTEQELTVVTEILDSRRKQAADSLLEQTRIEVESRKDNLDYTTKQAVFMDSLAARRKVEITNVIELARAQSELNALADENSYEHKAVISDANLERLRRQVDLSKQLIVLRQEAGRISTPEFRAEALRSAEAGALSERIASANRAIELEYQIANAGKDAALQEKVARLESIRAIQQADEDAARARIQAQVQIADQSVYHAERANAKILQFLASQKGITDIIADAKIGIIQTTFDYIDSGLDSVFGKLGRVGGLLKSIFMDLLRYAAVPFIMKLFGLGGGTGPAGGGGIFGGNQGGGIFSLLGGLTAHGSAGGASGGGLLGLLSGLTGGATGQGGGYTGGGVLGLIGGQLGSGGIGGLGTLTGQQAQTYLLHTLAGGGTAHAAGLAGSLGATGALATALPLLGITGGAGIGAMLGGGSTFGGILGGVGGGLLGGAAAFAGAGALVPGIFGTGGALAGLGGLAGLFTNPITIGIGAALLIGAVLYGISAKRRKNETDRAALNSDTYTRIITLLNSVRDGDTTIDQARAEWNNIKTDYFNRTKGYDSKTRKIAEKVWTNEFEPTYWPLIVQAAQDAQNRHRQADRLVPEFALGLDSPTQGRVPGRIGEAVLIMAHGGEKVLTIPQQLQYGVDNAVQGAQAGTGALEIYLEAVLEVGKTDATRLYVTGASTPSGRVAAAANARVSIKDKD